MTLARLQLQRHFGYPGFRPGQGRVVQSVLAGRDVLAVLPTGGGKSICFQVPALVKPGLTIVISPLIALMQDQVEALGRRGVPAASLNSTLEPDQKASILRRVAAGEIRLLYVSPERLVSLVPELRRLGAPVAMLAVDESHCISEWGHDFRPSYRLLGKARYLLARPQTVALTGSATPSVRRDIIETLGLSRPDLHLGSFDRPNLWFDVVGVRREADRWAALRQVIGRERRMTLVYAPTRNMTEIIARALKDHGFRAAPYHAGLPKAARARLLQAFLGDDVNAVVATSAFGMGIDKPDVRLVVHWAMPPTPESYYQEAGRAGRDGEFSRCVLLHVRGDAGLHRRQLDVTFPSKRLLERIWRGERARLPANVLESADRLHRELRPDRGRPDWGRIRRRRRLAESRVDAMESYARRRGCHRAMLLEYFGERGVRCAGCGHCGEG